jgi:hypothetical protein
MTIDKGEYRIGYEGIIKGKGWPGLSKIGRAYMSPMSSLLSIDIITFNQALIIDILVIS